MASRKPFFLQFLSVETADSVEHSVLKCEYFICSISLAEIYAEGRSSEGGWWMGVTLLAAISLAAASVL